MGEEEKQNKKQGWLIVGNPIVEIQSQLKKLRIGSQINSKLDEFETGFKSLLSKKPLFIEAAVKTASGAAQGAVFGILVSTVFEQLFPSVPEEIFPKFMGSMLQVQAYTGGPIRQARNFAAVVAFDECISCVLKISKGEKNLKGKRDMQTEMIAALGSGAMFSLTSGVGGPNQIGDMISSGLFFSLCTGVIHKYREGLAKPPKEDPFSVKTRSMLTNLGLQNYEETFKRCLLDDSALPFLTDSVLKDARIPPGHRLRILNHIERNVELDRSDHEENSGDIRETS